jgi:lipoprotein LpqH
VWNRFAAWSALGLAVLAISACSPSPPVQPGTLPPGTAQVTIDNKDMPETHTVRCTSIESLTTIATGNAAVGVDALVSNKDALNPKSVSIHGLGGFTGSYVEGLQGQANATRRGQTYIIRGTAAGFRQNDPSARTTGTFVVKVAC